MTRSLILIKITLTLKECNHHYDRQNAVQVQSCPLKEINFLSANWKLPFQVSILDVRLDVLIDFFSFFILLHNILSILSQSCILLYYLINPFNWTKLQSVHFLQFARHFFVFSGINYQHLHASWDMLMFL